MTSAPEMIDALQRHMKKGKKYQLQEIYLIIERHCSLDAEDYDPQSPGSSVPKWKRNVRGVLRTDNRRHFIYHDNATYELR